ncbi:MAG: YhfC family glutamic-type intramembrane protease [Chitinophagaceae bacterium]
MTSALAQIMDAPAGTLLLGAVERVFAIAAHLAMSLLVLQVFLRRNIAWLFASIGFHTLLNMVAVIAASRLNPVRRRGHHRPVRPAGPVHHLPPAHAGAGSRRSRNCRLCHPRPTPPRSTCDRPTTPSTVADTAKRSHAKARRRQAFLASSRDCDLLIHARAAGPAR